MKRLTLHELQLLQQKKSSDGLLRKKRVESNKAEQTFGTTYYIHSNPQQTTTLSVKLPDSVLGLLGL